MKCAGVVVLAVALSGVVTAFSQEVRPPTQMSPVVTGAPFSGERTRDFEPTGTSTTPASHSEEKMFRDSAGRVRTEFTYNNRTSVNLLDYPAHLNYRWTIGDTTVTRLPIKDFTPPATATAAERLGPNAPIIEGVPTRHSTNTQRREGEVVSTNESWYSPDLHLAMVTVIDKPDSGKTTYRFQHIVRAEPDAALFRVPAGMTIEDTDKAPPPPVQLINRAASLPRSAAASDAKPATPAYRDDPKFQKAFEQARTGRQTDEDRLENWKHANRIAKGQCTECLHQIINIQLRLSAWKDAVNSTQQLEALTAEPRERMFAEANRGTALMNYNYGQPKPDQLAQANAAFQDVLSKFPNEKNVLFQDGRALALMGKMPEAKAAFERYVDLVPASDRLRMRAERFSEDPHLATLAMAPPFRLVTTAGEELQLDDMNGKVVLLDFWATWCGPCKETLPEVARVAREYANDPMLVVISISQDADESAWKAFVQKNGMTWPQYRDRNNALSTAYGVTAIPRFFSIDTNGILKSEKVGSDTNVRAMVADLLKKAHKAEAQKARATDKPAGE